MVRKVAADTEKQIIELERSAAAASRKLYYPITLRCETCLRSDKRMRAAGRSATNAGRPHSLRVSVAFRLHFSLGFFNLARSRLPTTREETWQIKPN